MFMTTGKRQNRRIASLEGVWREALLSLWDKPWRTFKTHRIQHFLAGRWIYWELRGEWLMIGSPQAAIQVSRFAFSSVWQVKRTLCIRRIRRIFWRGWPGYWSLVSNTAWLPVLFWRCVELSFGCGSAVSVGKALREDIGQFGPEAIYTAWTITIVVQGLRICSTVFLILTLEWFYLALMNVF